MPPAPSKSRPEYCIGLTALQADIINRGDEEHRAVATASGRGQSVATFHEHDVSEVFAVAGPCNTACATASRMALSDQIA